MQAVEFKTVQKDGVIHIPDIYKNIISDELRVILLFENLRELKKKGKFEAFSISTKRFKFNREEANER